MFRGILAKLSAFKADAKGIVLYLVAMLLVPFVILIGVAVDVGQLLVIKDQLASAIDAATLDIGANPSWTQAQAQTQAQAFVNANFSTQNASVTLSNLTVTQNNSATPPTVTVTATATMNTAFLQIAGYSTLSTTASSTVTIAQNYLEVVLVLDNTGSMSTVYGTETGIQGLIAASTALVNTLYASDPTNKYVKIAVVPFTDNVNVGTQYSTASWIDNGNAVGSLSQENISVPTGTGLIKFASNLSSKVGNSSWAWGGCVRQRTEPYDVEDVAPTTANSATLYTPFFAPDEPDAATQSKGKYSDNCSGQSSFYNSYLCDSTCMTTAGPNQADQSCVTKYTTSPKVQSSGYGPNALCTVQKIIPLTDGASQTAIISEINAMTAYGATVIPAGLEWGWHVISPTVSSVVFPGNVAAPYSNTTTLKVIILLTDGYNDVQLGQLGVTPTQTTNGFNDSIYNAYGYGSGPHLNLISLPQSQNGVIDQPDYNLDQKEIALCNNIKAVTDAGGNPGRIQIYAIGFGTVINNSSLQLLQQCATDAAHYFYNPTSAELITTFQQIAIGLSKLRISQ